jgi:hypothetical protein
MPKLTAVERALRELQRLMSVPDEPPDPNSGGLHVRRVPAVLGQEEDAALSYSDDIAAVVRTAEAELLVDQNFEHLREKVNEAVWLFACRAYYEKDADLVPGFVEEHSRPIQTRKCYFTVEHLKAPKVEAFAGVDLLPVDHPDVPRGDPMFSTDAPVGSVAVIEATGTDYSRLAERGPSGGRARPPAPPDRTACPFGHQ